MWTTDYEWFGILSSISNPYSTFYDSTYLFDYHYYPLMTICVISLSWQCTRENGILHQYRSFLIQWVSFGQLIKTVILLMLHSTPFALWTSPQWNRICVWSVINLSTTNKRIISLSLTCQRNTTCNLYCFQMTLKYHLPTHSLCFLDIIIPPNQHHSTEYPKPSCIDIIIISPICNWNPIMAQSSSSHQQSPFVPVPYDQQPTHSNTLPFTTIEAHTYSFYSCLSLQSMVPIIHAVIQPIRWIHDTHNVQDMFHWRRWDQRKQPLFMVESKYHDDHDGAICIHWLEGSLYYFQTTR